MNLEMYMLIFVSCIAVYYCIKYEQMVRVNNDLALFIKNMQQQSEANNAKTQDPF